MAAHLKYKSGNSWIDYNLVVYPIGAIYISYTSTSPATLFGGTWTPITGRFPYFNAGTGTGGSNSQTIDFNHTHASQMRFKTSYDNVHSGLKYCEGESTVSLVIATNDSNWTGISTSAGLVGTKKTLGSKTISTMPAYQTLYAWRRTA